jgi:hypothetical protein
VAAAWQIWPLLVFYGLFYGLTEGRKKPSPPIWLPPRRRGAGFGLYHMSIGSPLCRLPWPRGICGKSRRARALGAGRGSARGARTGVGVRLRTENRVSDQSESNGPASFNLGECEKGLFGLTTAEVVTICPTFQFMNGGVSEYRFGPRSQPPAGLQPGHRHSSSRRKTVHFQLAFTARSAYAYPNLTRNAPIPAAEINQASTGRCRPASDVVSFSGTGTDAA